MVPSLFSPPFGRDEIQGRSMAIVQLSLFGSVVAHELCRTVYPDHSCPLLENVPPDDERRRQAQAANGAKYDPRSR